MFGSTILCDTTKKRMILYRHTMHNDEADRAQSFVGMQVLFD
jgi:hypothetical protein